MDSAFYLCLLLIETFAGASVVSFLDFQNAKGSVLGLAGAGAVVDAAEGAAEADPAAFALAGFTLAFNIPKRVGDGVEVCTRPRGDFLGLASPFFASVFVSDFSFEVATANLFADVKVVGLEVEVVAAALVGALETAVVVFAMAACFATGVLVVALEGEEVVAERPMDANRVRPEAGVGAFAVGMESVSFAFASFVGVLGVGSHFLRRSFTLTCPVGLAVAVVVAAVVEVLVLLVAAASGFAAVVVDVALAV